MHYPEILIPRKVAPSEVSPVIQALTKCWEEPRETPYNETLTPDAAPDSDYIQQWIFNGSEYGFRVSLYDTRHVYMEDFLAPVFAYFDTSDVFILVFQAPRFGDPLFNQVFLALRTHFGGIIDFDDEIFNAIATGEAFDEEKFLHHFVM